ncbi:uncharacterized protein LOC109047227 isoform X4 [Cyprinus carpio]|uniref:Uncharacterized protein LOC109047227 isoform X4 n=1 Tax=Cyprinus carpio TaxID=7962 RepID=A0A9Q9Z9M5_CYPCA|nr:uncharacterized protein LOC109047227 isoform X4 [Cyprinus carpio]XP_042634580.1 uncharacterized protein LOC109047227 isoform X4 [Cyprinus carpio]XP_042634582.1 uncharacterized protein LOC109047227 isoform X4 [Cyprinus carpio]
MKCSSRLLCGLLVSCLYFRVSSENLSVTQSPPNITVNEGESAQIKCCWNEIIQNVKVAWYIHEKKLNQDLQEHKTCAILNLTNILKNASGHYVCEVTQDIPVLLQENGSGTVITVSDILYNKTETVSSQPQTTQTAHSDTSPLSLPLSLAAAVGLLTLCLAFSVCKMRNSCKKSERVVIHQTPNSEGEEHEHMEEEDGSTGSSRGSLQWYQVPVYWSYFDLQRGEDQ